MLFFSICLLGMSSPSPFSLPLSLSILGGLTATFMISRVNQATPPVLLYFIVPLLVIYVLFNILSGILPGLEETGRRVGEYAGSSVLGGVDDTMYLQVFPTLFAVFMLFMVLLAAGSFKV